jgi:UDP-2,4-diacetamido-2,4,6-trideoxy-beta-L-altropyranose hydrolase
MILPGGSLRSAEPRIALRVDASSDIGTGHFMRCLTLADALRECGAQTRFVSRQLPEHLRNKLAAHSHESVLLDTVEIGGGLDELAHASWLGVSQAQDAADSLLALSDDNWDWLIVDHYGLDSRWESRMRQAAKGIFVIDDIADRPHDCELLLDQNFYPDMATRYSGKVPTRCQLLLGPRFALLRNEFRRRHGTAQPRSGPVRRIFVFFGGVDADNYTGHAITALSGIDLKGVHVDVVIGAQHPFRAQIEEACAQLGYLCHVQTDRMAELMLAADLAIGAGGSACWERCCLGLPTVLVALAENQINIAKALDSLGACLYIGTSGEASVTAVQDAIVALKRDNKRLQGISARALSLVDGLGAIRTCQAMNS